MEIWKDIIGYEGMYQISNLGNIKSLSRYRSNGSSGYMQKESLLKHINAYYPKISLWKSGKKKDVFVHCLVAKYFVPNPQNKQFVNHKNGIRTDFSVDNLEWVTRSENNQHAYDIGLKIGCGRKPVIQLSRSGALIALHVSELAASSSTGVERRNIRRNLQGKRPSAGGFVWTYAITDS